ncbi:MAG: hypothetical protein M3Q81_02075 [bacterium]|nr:hypothetical protein [bacterium]
MINANPYRPDPTPTAGSTNSYTPATTTQVNSNRLPAAPITAMPVTATTPSAPFSPNKPNAGKKNLKYLLGGLFLLLLLVGGGAGYFLVQQSQDVRQQASEVYNCVGGSKLITIGVDAGACACPDGSTISPGASCGGTADNSCNSSTHCCNPNGCSVTTYVRE